MGLTWLRAWALLGLVLVGGILRAQSWTPPPAINFDPMTAAGESADYTVWNVTFLSAVITDIPANNQVKLRVYLPNDSVGPVPVVLLLHYWGAPDTKVEDEIATLLARRGIASVAMPLPYHLARSPIGRRSGELAILPDPQALNRTMSQAVLDVQRTIDFIETRHEFDREKIGVGGTSLGAIVAATAFGVEPRIKTATFLLGGADLAGLVYSSSKVSLIKNALERKGIGEAQLRQALAPSEATSYLRTSDKRPTLLVTARFDTVVPTRSSDALANALGNNERIMLDTGHFGGFLVQARLAQTVARYFDSKLNGHAFALPRTLFAPTVRLGLTYDSPRGLQIALGMDIWRANVDRDGFGAVLLSPKGVSFFLGKDIGNGLSVGASIMPRHASLGAFWSVVF
jgi:dienelactone hydrolase